MSDLGRLLELARRARPELRGPELGLFVPGMVVYEGKRGRFPAMSITGGQCSLQCAHCRGGLLQGMADASTPESLLQRATEAQAKGNVGILVSGGCAKDGRLPWDAFADALAEIKRQTGLFVAVHSGFVDAAQANLLAQAGVDLAMIDVIGDDATAKDVYGLSGAAVAAESLSALVEAGLNVAPHIVAGLNHGRIVGEERAVEVALQSGAKTLVFVVLMPLKGTAMAQATPPAPEDVARLICGARLAKPEITINLGCGRPRGAHAARLDELALMAGVDNIAVPAPETAELAARSGREPVWRHICCTAPLDLPGGVWGEQI